MTETFKRIGLGVGAAAIAVIIAGVAHKNLSAQGPGFGGPGGGGFGGPGGGMGRRGGPGEPGLLGPMVLERLDLSSDQHDRVKQILDSHRDERRALGDRAMKAHEALLDAMTGTFDESAVRSRAADVAGVDADQAVAQARIYGEVYQILTSEQQEKLKTIQTQMKERQAKMREHRGQRGNDGNRH
jgi:periplasmic protein CpxP/Spy